MSFQLLFNLWNCSDYHTGVLRSFVRFLGAPEIYLHFLILDFVKFGVFMKFSWVTNGGFELMGMDWFSGDLDREEIPPIGLDLVVFRASSGFGSAVLKGFCWLSVFLPLQEWVPIAAGALQEAEGFAPVNVHYTVMHHTGEIGVVTSMIFLVSTKLVSILFWEY